MGTYSIIERDLGNRAVCCYHFLLDDMGIKQGEGLIILHTGGPCIMETSGMRGIKPTTPVTEAHPPVVNKVNPVVTISIYISIFHLINLMTILGFISLTLRRCTLSAG